MIKNQSMIQHRRNMSIKFIFPTILFLVVFSIIPMVYSFIMSLQSYNTSMPKDSVHFIGMQNYIDILTNQQFISATLWTFSFTISVVTLNVFLGLIISLILTYGSIRKSARIFKTLFILPMMIAPIVTASMWKLIFSPIYGLLNGLLVSNGMQRIEWLSKVLPARFAIISVEVWATTSICMLIFMAAFRTVPDECLEAATTDGANPLQKFRHIILPFIRNHIALIVTIRFMDSVRMFDIVYNLTNGGPGTSTETLASTIYKTAFRYFNIGQGAAAAYIFFILILIFSLISIKLLSKKNN